MIPIAMRPIIGLLLVLLFSLVPNSNASEPDPALFNRPADRDALLQLTKQLNQGPQAYGQFSQARHLAVLTKPLLSEGEFTFDADLGLAWQQQRPFYSALILSGEQVTQIDSQGKRQSMQAQGPAAEIAKLMPQLLQAILSGDIHQLEQSFQIGFIQQPQQWQIGLLSQSAELSAVLPKIIISGDTQVRQLQLLSDNGDRSEISFKQISYAPLTEQQIAIFAPQNRQTEAASPQQ
ncbi:outer membrane lipoprotein carrier protein LolA [Shewanella sp. Scap07]|uniref:outer membrane lipoprotein carrier protein LolA n=1 Tax=Shewanella sp. Scap07 TaxID=2589987 RepID=UPI0015BF3DB0|nr:outer membrane lipoprotein carrier protein LolA [Shewanella sp. Scap07]QLE87290.1 outer membrane lipoprotein carrier protein LolA [Shewanella sp. Scap07]